MNKQISKQTNKQTNRKTKDKTWWAERMFLLAIGWMLPGEQTNKQTNKPTNRLTKNKQCGLKECSCWQSAGRYQVNKLTNEQTNKSNEDRLHKCLCWGLTNWLAWYDWGWCFRCWKCILLCSPIPIKLIESTCKISIFVQLHNDFQKRKKSQRFWWKFAHREKHGSRTVQSSIILCWKTI